LMCMSKRFVAEDRQGRRGRVVMIGRVKRLKIVQIRVRFHMRRALPFLAIIVHAMTVVDVVSNWDTETYRRVLGSRLPRYIHPADGD